MNTYEDSFNFQAKEFDIDYEFDAPRFFDFCRPEKDWEAEEAELWFQSAWDYRLSYLIVKSNLTHEVFSQNVVDNQIESKDDHIVKDSLKTKMKSAKISPLSRLMKPTASLLAKLNQQTDVHSCQCSERCHKSLSQFRDKVSLNSSVNSYQATKRQKLDAGYLSKVTNLNHQDLIHKAPKKERNLNQCRPKLTVPKEPELRTASRAHRHRSKMNIVDLIDHTQLGDRTLKGRSVNGKLMTASSLPLPKRKILQPPEFREFHLRTSERALQRASSNILDKREKIGGLPNLKKEPAIPHFKSRIPDKKTQEEVPVGLFSKLSLKSESQLRS